MAERTINVTGAAPVRRGVWALLSGPLQSFWVLGLFVAAAGVLALLSVPEVPRWLTPLGALPGALYYALASRRERERERLRRLPFPSVWREVLERRVAYYRQLGDAERRRFEEEVLIFLGEQRIYPLPGAAQWQQSGLLLEEEHLVLIAASAATLLLGRPEWRLPTVRDIVVYPSAFSEGTYEADPWGHTVGMVHAQGPILLSLPALLHAYPERPKVPAGIGGTPAWAELPQDDPPPNVGLHEFAHVIDFISSEGRAGGVPALLSREAQGRWQRQFQEERERLQQGQSLLHPYALKSDAELFAVAVETFFTNAVRLRALHPGLYRLLSEFFNQNPAEHIVPRALWSFPWGGIWFGPRPNTRPQA